MRLFEIRQKLISCPYTNSVIQVPLYHGTTGKFAKFNRVPHGVFFTPHRNHTKNYGDDVIVCYVNIPKLHILNTRNKDDRIIFDALFDRDYEIVAQAIKKLEKQGYYAMQTQSDSEMICVFDNAEICSANSGEEM